MFYIRRCRWLIPALVFMLIIVLFASNYLLVAGLYTKLARKTVWAEILSSISRLERVEMQDVCYIACLHSLFIQVVVFDWQTFFLSNPWQDAPSLLVCAWAYVQLG